MNRQSQWLFETPSVSKPTSYPASMPDWKSDLKIDKELGQNDIPSPEHYRRTLREHYAKYKHNCAGATVLRRLTRKPRNHYNEYARLLKQLTEAERSGSEWKLANAKCELSLFWWEYWGTESLRDQYRDVTKKIKATQAQLEDERWWYRRWQCENWPRGVRQPKTTKQGCQQKATKIKKLENELSKLQTVKQELENELTSYRRKL